MTDFLDEKRNEITDRLKVLKPAVDEFNRLEAAASALASVGGSNAAAATATIATPRRRGPGRPRGSKTTTTSASVSPKPASAKPAAKRGGRRRKRTGKRAAQALKLIVADPGITIPALAEKMGIKANYLYRLLPPLEQAGKIRKDGRGWHPKKT